MGLRRGLLFLLLCLVLAVVAVFLDFFLIEGLQRAAQRPGYYPAYGVQPGHGEAVIMALALGGAGMAWGWHRGFKREADAAAVLGALMWVFLGYADARPYGTEVLAAFLLPWVLLFVDLEPRHRLVLLAVQWLSSAMLLEVWTGGVATAALLALALAHILLVWASLPDGPLRRVPLGVAVLVAATSMGTTLWFFYDGPSLQRAGVALACSLVIAGAVWLARTGRFSTVRVPVLLRRPAPDPA